MPSQVKPQDRAEIVERLYDVALDPIRLEELLDTWEESVGPTRQDDAARFDDPEIESHLNRASVFLDRFEATRSDAIYRSVLEDIPRSAAFLADQSNRIAAFNRPAEVAFGLGDGAMLQDLPFEADDLPPLKQAILRALSAPALQPVETLRLRSKITGSPVVLRVGRIEGERAHPFALVISTELVWPEGFEVLVAETFSLTGAEVEIVRSITLGIPVKKIAEMRHRSEDTVRTQLRSILGKTETHSQSELVRVVLGLADVAKMPSGGSGGVRARNGLQEVPFRSFKGPGHRRLDYIEFGDPLGRPVLYMPIDYMMIRWPATAERAARQRGLRVIALVRAGYGHSEHHPKGVEYATATAEDYAALLGHLGIRQAAVLCLGADIEYAMRLSQLRPGLITGILGCGARLPTQTPDQYKSMGKWHRFILANARYAPRILPFLVQAGYAFARRVGKEKFLMSVNATSRADIEVFSRPEVREAILVGSEVTLSEKFSAHEAFTREVMASEADWSEIVRKLSVPNLLLVGDQDPQVPVQTALEMRVSFPNLDIRIWPESGQLLFFGEWPRVLDHLEEFLPKS
jgi:pimeloyl-ACP methyl ester carboxylesterase/DNA-binding CsgD family transcriptional regulator